MGVRGGEGKTKVDCLWLLRPSPMRSVESLLKSHHSKSEAEEEGRCSTRRRCTNVGLWFLHHMVFRVKDSACGAIAHPLQLYVFWNILKRRNLPGGKFDLADRMT